MNTDRIKNYIYLFIYLGGSLLLIYLSLGFAVAGDHVKFVGFFSLLSLLLMFIPVSLDTSVEYSLEDIVLYGVIFLKGAFWGVWVIFLSSLVFEIIRLVRAWIVKKGDIGKRAVFYNFAVPFLRVIVAGISGIFFEWTFGIWNIYAPEFDFVPYLLSILVFFLLSTFMVNLLITLEKQFTIKEFRSTWDENWGLVSPHILIIAPMGALFALLYKNIPWATLLLAIPLFILHITVKSLRVLLKEAVGTIEFMATTLDQRDDYTFGHSERVSLYADAIARAMKLPEWEIRQIRRAGLIHDIGKISIPDRVLTKPSSLSDEEYSLMKTHTHTTAVLFKSFSVLSKEIPMKLAMYHHERYDGQGYIFGLKGDDIPLGSRILSVADTYDAITSDRPYRKGLGEEEARHRIIECSGTQLDPKVVAVFLQLQEKGEFQKIRMEYEKEKMKRTDAGEEKR